MESVASRSQEAFEGWLLRRMNRAVDSGEMPAHLLAEVEAELANPTGCAPAVRHPVAIRLIADLARVPRTQAGELLAALETKNPSGPEQVLQGIAEAWLRQWRAECRGPERKTRAEEYDRLQGVGSHRKGRLGGATEAVLEMQERDTR